MRNLSSRNSHLVPRIFTTLTSVRWSRTMSTLGMMSGSSSPAAGDAAAPPMSAGPPRSCSFSRIGSATA
jgi:hypothetical protein